jgi:hypothetical protein
MGIVIIGFHLRSPIFGDLHLIRNSTVHHRDIALENVDWFKIFNGYKTNEDIFNDGDKMTAIVAS